MMAPVDQAPVAQGSGGIGYLARHGLGETVVFLHGIGSNAASFLPVLQLLPEDLNLIAWNAPGYLGSAPLGQDWPVAGDYAQALEQFLDRLGHEKVHLVGHSLGTLIAAAFARRQPDRLHSLTLSSVANGYGVTPGNALTAGAQARLDDLARLGPDAFAAARAANLIHQPEAFSQLVAKVQAAMAQINPTGYAQAVRMLASGNLPADLAHVATRPGFIIGVQDRVTPLAQTITAANAWAQAHGSAPAITEIDQAGHAVYLQRPAAFCAALLGNMGHPAAPHLEGSLG